MRARTERFCRMASITKRKDSPYWRAQVRRLGYEPLSRTFDTKADAEIWARHIEGEMDRGVHFGRSEAERMTLAQALERYRREIVPLKRHPDQEHQRINRWLDYSITGRSLTNLRGADFAAYRDARRAAGRAENTIRLELALISHLFEIARKEWRMEGLGNPLKDIRKPSGSNARDRRLLPGEFRLLYKLLARSGNVYAAPAMVFAIETALRQAILFELRWEWLDWEHRTIAIPLKYQAVGNKGVPKLLPLSSRALKVLRRLHPKQRDGQLCRQPSGPVFATTQNAVVMAFKKVKAVHVTRCNEEGRQPLLVDLRWHDLRHEACSRLVGKMRNLLHVRAITGHKTVAMLARYDHPGAEELLAQLG